MPRVQAMIGAEGGYRPFRGFEYLSTPVKALLLASLQVASFDFYTDSHHKGLYINKQHFSPTQLLMLRKFIEGRAKPFIKGKA